MRMFLIYPLTGFGHLLKSFFTVIAARLRISSAPAQQQPSNAPRQIRSNNKRERKGDPALLANKETVSYKTAELFLGIGVRQVQKLVKAGTLEVRGLGLNKRITTQSLLRYLPPNSRKEAT